MKALLWALVPLVLVIAFVVAVRPSGYGPPPGPGRTIGPARPAYGSGPSHGDAWRIIPTGGDWLVTDKDGNGRVFYSSNGWDEFACGAVVVGLSAGSNTSAYLDHTQADAYQINPELLGANIRQTLFLLIRSNRTQFGLH